MNKNKFSARKLDRFLSGYFWPNELEVGVRYATTFKNEQELSIVFSVDGDAWITVNGNNETPLVVSAENFRLFRALAVVAQAIEWDNDRRPLIEGQLTDVEVERDFEFFESTALSLIEVPRSFIRNMKDKHYERTHDDCDGNRDESLRIWLTKENNLAIAAKSLHLVSLRFRMPFTGGGLSPRVRSSLLLLALALKRDEEDTIQPRLPFVNWY